jgi:hypothetical protein
MKTIIHTCSDDMAPQQLSDDHPWWTIGAWWPEIEEGIPVTEEAQVEVALNLVGKTIITVSPIIILTMLREVRVGRMDCTDLNIYCNGKIQAVDTEGELINPWPGGFSRTRSHLLFHDE